MFVKDSLLTLFPERSAEIADKVDPGEYGLESWISRWICLLIFVMAIVGDLINTYNLMMTLLSVVQRPAEKTLGEPVQHDEKCGL